MNNKFLLFSSPKPRCQVYILIYRNWSIQGVPAFWLLQAIINLANGGNVILKIWHINSMIGRTPKKLGFLGEHAPGPTNIFTLAWKSPARPGTLKLALQFLDVASSINKYMMRKERRKNNCKNLYGDNILFRLKTKVVYYHDCNWFSVNIDITSLAEFQFGITV